MLVRVVAYAAASFVAGFLLENRHTMLACEPLTQQNTWHDGLCSAPAVGCYV